jgi:hypothetical protein
MPLSGAAGGSMPAAAFLHRLLRQCLDIRAIWSVGHGPGLAADEQPGHRIQLLVFADAPTLERLRKSADLHCDEVELLVVVDGDSFENAWGARRLSGSLSRWAWREVSADHAFYDESRWDPESSASGTVVRVRREAHLIWRLQEQPVT